MNTEMVAEWLREAGKKAEALARGNRCSLAFQDEIKKTWSDRATQVETVVCLNCQHYRQIQGSDSIPFFGCFSPHIESTEEACGAGIEWCDPYFGCIHWQQK
jgi:hypothetical protein